MNKRETGQTSASLLPLTSTEKVRLGTDATEKPNRGIIDFVRSHLPAIGAAAVLLLLGVGIMASNGWLPSTSGKRTGWFGKELPKNASSSWNPVATVFPTPAPTPQLSKEFLYAGSRLLSVVDANALEAPPADLAVWRPSNGYWYVLGGVPGSNQTFFQLGANGDKPVQGDFDGDGKTDFAVFRSTNGTWYITKSSTQDANWYGSAFGVSGDKPAQADYDGDGKTDTAVYRPSDGTWYYVRSSDQVFVGYQFGTSTDVPAPADYDGDGKADVTVWRPADHTFYTVRSSDMTLQTAPMGSTGDTPVPADYDGDGKANYALRSGGNWIIRNASGTADPTTSWGAAGDTAVPNDYDGDGKCDIAVWRPSNGYWYILQSHDGLGRYVQWGACPTAETCDIPVPAYFRR